MAADMYRIIVFICLAGVLLLSPVIADDETPTPTPTQTFIPVNIDFSANTTGGYAPLHVLFTDTTESSGEVYSREWNFGDGSWFEDSTPEVVHTYTDPGLYTVTFNRRDEQGTHVKIRYNFISVAIPPTPTPTVTQTTPVTTTPTTSVPTTQPTTSPTITPSPTPTSSEPPAEFWGSVSELGIPAPAGSLITAMVGDQERGSITTSEPGIYGGSGPFDERLRVNGTEGEIITFWLNGRQSEQTAVFSSGSLNLDLSFAVPPTTIPTTNPTTSPTTIPTTTSPTTMPTTIPTTTSPTTMPTTIPTTPIPTTIPTTVPTTLPTTTPTTSPTFTPSPTPTSSEPPAEYWGIVSELGIPAPAGSLIIAMVGDQERGRINTSISGIYGGSGPFDERLRVNGTEGEIITFWLNGRQSEQTSVFSSGSLNLDLAFVVPPTTGPTTMPTTSIPTTTPFTTVPTTSPQTTIPTTIPTTTPTPIPDMYLPLYQGWNFISIPLALEEGHNTGDIFSMIDTDGRITWTYNASLSQWQRITPDTPFEQMQGIWIYSAQFEQFGLYFSKHQIAVSRPFYEGWNAMGIPGSHDRAARDALAPVFGSWVYAIGFNGASQEYDKTIISGGTGELSDLRHMFPARGYWVFFRENATYEELPSSYL